MANISIPVFGEDECGDTASVVVHGYLLFLDHVTYGFEFDTAEPRHLLHLPAEVGLQRFFGTVEVSFCDTGGGIPAADLARIFEPYRTTKGAEGNGLGLLICRRIVRAHGGEIDVESKEGEGTRFTVRLPRIEKRVRRLA